MIEPLVAAGSFDLMVDFAGAYPMEVISELVGVPAADRDMLRGLGREIMYVDEESTDLRPEAVQAIGALIGYYTELTIERSKQRRDDLLSDLLDASDAGDRLTPEEIVGVLILLVGAGVEAPMLSLGNIWYSGHRHRAQRPFERLDEWIAETMRWDPSTQTLLRTTTRDIELHGTKIRAGERILLITGSANRDPEVFPEPDTFDLNRDTSASLIFGSGRHHCLGVSLGQLELRTALTELLAAITEYEIDPEGTRRIHSSNNRGFAALPTQVKAR
ncbi:cytochrome P450 [Nocardia brasiliensis]|nr:cytochrome P450 [Nocardia brasiliensis]